MTPPRESPKVREAVGVFDSAEALEAAVDEILSHGFDRADLSLLAGAGAVEEKLGHLYRRADEIEDDPRVPRTAYVARESVGDAEGGLIGALLYVGAAVAVGATVASGGALGAAIVAASVGGATGGMIGLTLAEFLDQHHADRLQDQLDRGGLLLWVRTRDADRERTAADILTRHAARDVHVHGIAA